MALYWWPTCGAGRRLRPGRRIPDVANKAFETARSGVGTDSVGYGKSAATEGIKESSSTALDRATEFGREQADAASDYARSIPNAGTDMFDTARSNLTELFRAQPLALGAIGLAIGAGIAAALPPSDVETAYLGETSDSLKTKAAEFPAEQTTRATELAEDVVEAVTEEARRQGLTIEGAKSAVGDVSAKVGRVVDAAEKGISDRVRSATSQLQER